MEVFYWTVTTAPDLIASAVSNPNVESCECMVFPAMCDHTDRVGMQCGDWQHQCGVQVQGPEAASSEGCQVPQTAAPREGIGA